MQRACHRGGEVAAARAALGSAGARGRVGEHQREQGGRWGGSVVTRGRQREARGGRAGSPRRRRRALHSGGEKQRKELEEGEKGYFAISENSRDETVKQR